MNIAMLLSKMNEIGIDGRLCCGRLYAIHSERINVVGVKIKTSKYELGVYDEDSNTWYWYYQKKYRFFNKKDRNKLRGKTYDISKLSDSNNYFIE